MNIGALRHRIEIQAHSGTTQNSFGEPVENWTRLLDADASVQPLRGLERYASQQTQSTADTKVTMRYRSGIDTQKRVKFGARIFDIESVINIDERNQTLELLCKEAVS